MKNNECKKKKGLGKFLVGAGIGATLGVLFAPKKGSETRKELKIKIDELIEKLKNVDADEVKDAIEAKIFEIKSELEDLDKEKVLKIAKKKANQIKDMAEELVNYVLSEFEEDKKKIWDSNIFGKSVHDLVNEGLQNKLARMPEEAQMKIQETLQRIVNEGSGGLIFIIL